MAHYEEPIGESFLVKGAQGLDPAIQVRLNQNYVRREDPDQEVIEDADDVTFLRLMAGG